MSAYRVTGSFAGTGQSASSKFTGGFNFVLWGSFVGTVQLESSYDAGVTWLPVSKDANGVALIVTVPCNITLWQPESDVLYRANCTAFTSGPINYRLSGTN